MCTGFYETCNCNDCNDAKVLYIKLSSLESESWLDDNESEELKEVQNRLENMGYTI